MLHALFMKGRTPVWIQPSCYTYRPPKRDVAWTLREVPDNYVGGTEDPSKFRVVERHTPRK